MVLQHTPTPMPSAAFCLWKYLAKNKFNQRSENMQKQRKDNISLVIKHKQGPLVPSQGL